MHINKELYEFLHKKTWELTENWYADLDRNSVSGVYASQDPSVVEGLKQQNHEFHKRFIEVFQKDEASFFKEFEKWVLAVAQDKEHLVTPIQDILREFFRTQDQYLDLLTEFIRLNVNKYSKSQIESWYRITIKTFGRIMIWFTEEHNNHSQKRLNAQQELIVELSSPVISLSREIALLPLVGDIDTARAKFMIENTLKQCAKLGVNQLFLDLSGVVMIDTMVAHQLFQLIEALNLLGVKTTLSGVRPEIAQTAVQLGLSFDHISVKSTLSSAISSADLT
ncbi:STAS domain-containing protein [Peribacillus kribbensis]|uniref:STAS domain-containing protein n=1 Tax=Peribacillus kribbensis TaxID=356658 RepID=UPI000404DC6E|nr:STAS domain-containing protein [Peribacillus kribbensis]